MRCSTPLPTAAGTLLHGRYRIEKLLAMGGFGAVYLAVDTKSGNRQVAIKDMICADPQEFAIRLNFFRREAEILRSLASMPIVPRVYDLIEQDKTAHLVMEFIRGQDLLRLMENNNNQAFPAEQVLAVAPRFEGRDLWSFNFQELPLETMWFSSPAIAEGYEMALFDLAGKALGLPVSRLFGGAYRDRVPVSRCSGRMRERELTPQQEAK